MFWDSFRHCRKAQAIKWSNNECPAVTSTTDEQNSCLETLGAFRVKCCGSNWWSWSTLRALSWASSNYRAISREILHGSLPSAANLHWFVSVKSVGIHKFRMCHTSRLKQALLQLSTCISVWITLNRIRQDEFPCISTKSTLKGTKGEQHVTVIVACVFHNHPLITEPWCTYSRSQWPRGLRCRSAAASLLRLWVRIPPGAWMFVCCECFVLSGRGLCDGLITRPEESYRL